MLADKIVQHLNLASFEWSLIKVAVLLSYKVSVHSGSERRRREGPVTGNRLAALCALVFS